MSITRSRPAAALAALVLSAGTVQCSAAHDHNPAGIDWQALDVGAIARTETTVAQFRRYSYPTGERADGAQCLTDCGAAARTRAVRHGAALSRGHGHALAGATPAGVNGLHDMGANVWEWVDEPRAAAGDVPRRTRGGSWWYGRAQMQENHLQDKPPDTAVVYIGFRCLQVP